MPRCSRRSALCLLAASAGLAALSGCAPALDVPRGPVSTPRVAVWNSSLMMSNPLVAAFLDELKSLGYTVGGNIDLEWRLKDDSWDRPSDVVAQELVALQPRQSWWRARRPLWRSPNA